LLIIGGPGTGKTVLCIEFLFQLLNARAADAMQPMPVLLSLNSWNVNMPLLTWIYGQLTAIYNIPKEAGRSLIKNGRIAVILDGLEEAVGTDGAQLDVQATTESFKIAIRDALRGRIIVTCRYNGDVPLEEFVDSTVFQILHIGHLEPRQVARYLAGRYRSISGKGSIDQNWKTVHDLLTSRQPGVLGLAFETPWRLSIATTAVDSGQIAVAELSKLRSLKDFDDQLLSRFIPASLALASARHDAKIRFTAMQFKAWLATLAKQVSEHENEAYTTNKVIIHQLWPIAGRRSVQMLHGVVSVVGGALLAANGAEFASGAGGFLSAGIYALAGMALGVWAAIDASPSPSRLSLRGIRSWKSIALVSIFAASEGLLNSIGGGLAVGVTVGLLCMFVGIIVTGFRGGVIERTPRPMDKLNNDLIFGVALGVTIGLASGLPGGFTGGLIYELGVKRAVGYIPSIFIALLIGIICGVCIGSRSWLRYGCARVIWTWKRTLPFRLAKFLKDAYRVDILRAAGGAYDFRHDMLRSWLARLHP
jgi:hypothetical protein